MKSDERTKMLPPKRLFLEHPAAVGETYLEHLGVAFGFGVRLTLSGLACMVHGIFPWMFVTTASSQVRLLYERMTVKRVRHVEGTPHLPADRSCAARPSSSERPDVGPHIVSCNLTRWASGTLLSLALAATAVWISSHISLPPMVVVLLLGLCARGLMPNLTLWCSPGINFCMKTVLQIGVALLGLRFVLSDVTELGMRTIFIVILSVGATFAAGIALGRLIGQRSATTAIASTSVAICGASAALAASAVLRSRTDLRQETSVVILGVSLLGTAAMILYPWLARMLGFDPLQTSILLGASIHDVAQVAGAGLTISPQVATEAVTVKMIRIACLLPVILLIGAQIRTTSRDAAPTAERRLLIPHFLIAFIAIAMLASTGLIHGPLLEAGQQTATLALTVAVAAIGLSISPSDLRKVPPTVFFALVGQTLIQLLAVILLIEFAF